MTTTRPISHTDCSHESTKAARAQCRKDRADAYATRKAAIDALFAASAGDGFDWIFYGATRMAGLINPNQEQAAQALLDHFAPSGDEAKDARRRRNGYIITTDPRTIRSIVLRAAS